MRSLKSISILCFLMLFVIDIAAQENGIEIVPIARGLNNPRGVAVTENGNLLVVEAGTGSDTPEIVVGSGRILSLSDNNNDGDFDDEGERIVRLDEQPSFNSLTIYRTGHDEPFGLNDILLLDNNRVLYTLDNPFAEPIRNFNNEVYEGEVGIFALNTQRDGVTQVVESSATLNSFVYDPSRELFYITESGRNRIMSSTLDGQVLEQVIDLPILANNQQPVPAGITIDPTTNDVLVSLFSGFVYNYYETQIGFMQGDAKVMRFDPDTGELTDEITGLTTAIDVTAAPNGDLFVVELTTSWAQNPMPLDYDLFDPTLPPDPGGYARYTGRVTLHPADGSEPVIIADALDMPTNVTYHEGDLYVSTGMGTPNRRVITPQGIQGIEGIIYRISGF